MLGNGLVIHEVGEWPGYQGMDQDMSWYQHKSWSVFFAVGHQSFASFWDGPRHELVSTQELKCLLCGAKAWGINHFQVFKDSQAIINWALLEVQVKSLEIQHWLTNSKRLMKEFFSISFFHFYWELNVEEEIRCWELNVEEGIRCNGRGTEILSLWW